MSMKCFESDENVFIFPGAKVMGNVTFGPGCSVWYNAVLRGDEESITLGKKCNVQDNAVFHTGHHPTVLGDNVTVGHGAIVHGCTVGSNTLIGMGAIVLDGAIIGSNCMVAAGALVTGKMNAPDGSMIMGHPARVTRPLTPEELYEVADAADHYFKLKELHR